MLLRELRKSVKPLMWVVAIGFVASLFFTYARMSSRSEGEKPLVEVNGEKISYLDFARTYYDAYQRYTENTGAQISPEMENYLRSQVLSQLISNALLYQEAKKAGIKVDSEEVKREVQKIIITSFGSRENFMRYLDYRKIKYSDFEEKLRRQIAISKLTQLITSNVMVTEREVKDYWMLKNESIDLAYLFLNPQKYTKDIKINPEEAKKYYDENKEEFRVEEKVRVEYILISPDEFKNSVKIEETDLKKYYEEHSEEFKVKEKRRASHILIGIPQGAEEKKIQEAREKIEEIKKKLEEGADFAELARKYSDDKVSAEKGGDLGWFTYEDMTPNFSKAVFSMKKVGEISDVVETPYGLHLIKLTGIKPAYQKSFEEVKEEIRKILIQEKTEEIAKREIEDIKEKIQKGRISFEEYAKENPEKVKTTPLFTRYGKVDELSWNPRFNEIAFSLKPGEISAPLRIKEGWCIMTLRERKPSYIPDWEEAKEKVMEKLAREKAEKLTVERANDIVKKVREKKEKLSAFANEWDYGTLNSLTRESWISGLYEQDREKFLKVAFSLPEGKVSDPIFLTDGFYIIQVTDRKIPLEKFEQEKEEFKKELLADKKQRLLSAWFLKVREKAKIVDNTRLFFASSS